MAQQVPLVRLNDGNSIPQLGFGVWQVSNEEVTPAVRSAIETGYRMIDTAQGYDNEEGVGQAIRDCGVAREDLFITSKLRTKAQAYDDAIREFEVTLEKLGLDYLDMFLIHWPVPARDKYVEAWKAFIQLQKDGRIRTIGVSNFLPEHIDRIVRETGVTPAVNQIELHPEYQQRDVRDYHRQRDIRIESYSPLGSGAVLDSKDIKAIADKHGKSVAQVIIRWHLQQGLIVIPKSTHADRISQNFDVFGFELDADDLQKIARLDRPDGKTGNQPAEMNDLY
jgi:2,5-diketo-D-gluconate reductase A